LILIKRIKAIHLLSWGTEPGRGATDCRRHLPGPVS
jgi:hypothetical protein